MTSLQVTIVERRRRRHSRQHSAVTDSHNHHASFPTSPPSRINPHRHIELDLSAVRKTLDEVIGQGIILFDDDRAFSDLSNPVSCFPFLPFFHSP
ncbi:hypothetical protein R3P38DRAFT_3299495 [Favolaschia claudopus]|uniref:Uncharacterized protein n=1 Tax=Favolaschia claudopus TaxID=2862362 RepID=A0AAV9Z0A9_9AGAR